jgi:hypothetical protein
MEAKELNDTLEREKILNRLELRASVSGVEEPYLDDVRNHFEKRSKDGEDLSARTIGDHIEQLRSNKPRYFKASSRTSPATDSEKRKGTNGDTTKLDYADPANDKAFRRLVGSWGIKVV